MQGKVELESSAAAPVYAGIDVSKDWLDVYLHPAGVHRRVANDAPGIKLLGRQLGRGRTAGVVLEATGKYHRLAYRMLSAAGLPVAVVNPLRARLFAEAGTDPAKTDRLDAKVLAAMAAMLQPQARPPVPEQLEDLAELVNARAAATTQATALTNRLGTARASVLRAELKRQVKAQHAHVGRLDGAIAALIETDPELRRRYAILVSIPAIGPVVAAGLLAGLSEMGQCTHKQASRLVGVAPIADDSGRRQGQRHIRGGRAQLRRILYMAALTAARHNPDLHAFYARLRANGKPPKLALTAVIRKLVVLANTLITQNRTWTPIPPKTA